MRAQRVPLLQRDFCNGAIEVESDRGSEAGEVQRDEKAGRVLFPSCLWVLNEPPLDLGYYDH